MRIMDDKDTSKEIVSAHAALAINTDDVEENKANVGDKKNGGDKNGGDGEGPMGTEFGELPPKRGSCIGFFKQYRKEFVLTQNGKILLVAIVLFGTITTAQFAAAFIANSLALLADCGSMLADVITYVFNFLAECRPNRSHVKGKLVASLLSLLVLVAIAIWALHDAIVALATAAESGADAGPGTVNPNIVLAFGIVGIIFDIVALVAFLVPDRFWRRTEIDEQNEVVRISTDELSEGGSSTAHAMDGRSVSPEPSQTPMVGAQRLATKKRTRINMLSALLHIGADAMRSATTIASAAIMLSNPEWNSNKIDSVAALVVSTLVLITGFVGFVMWGYEFRKFWYRHRPQAGRRNY